MRTVAVVAGLLVVGLATGACDQRAPDRGPVEVETFTAKTTHRIDLPAALDKRGGVDLTGRTRLSELRFAPGEVEFAGRSVDFAGTEDDFLASFYTGQVHVPAARGPGETEVRGVITASGFAFPDTLVGNSHAEGVKVGPSFALESLDLVPEQELLIEGTTLSWKSPVIPELNGASVTLRVDKTITVVDPVAGLLDIEMDGTILASQEALSPERRVSRTGPGLTSLLVAGIGLIIVIQLALLRRRRGTPG